MATTTFYVKQKKEMLEAITGWETANQYLITDTSHRTIAEAKEISGGLSRNFLKGLRPFEMDVTNRDGDYIMFLDKKFAFFQHQMEVCDGNKRYLGSVTRNLSIMRDYTIENSAHRPIFQIKGPIWRPWTFDIFQGEVKKGSIQKQWSGFFKEALTDADNFSVIFPEEWDGDKRSLLMAACILIDFIHFEN